MLFLHSKESNYGEHYQRVPQVTSRRTVEANQEVGDQHRQRNETTIVPCGQAAPGMRTLSERQDHQVWFVRQR